MTLPDALTEVARRVEGDAWRVREDAVSSEEVAQMAVMLLDAVLAEHAGQDPGELPRTTLARGVLGLCRRHLLAVWSESPVSDVFLLNLLGAMERVVDRIQPRWETRFADRMAGPDGLELVAEVMHDLRSPLTSILFPAETLMRGHSGPVSAVQERQLALIYSAAFGLSTVTADAMDLARGDARVTEPVPLLFSVSDLLASIVEVLAPVAAEKGVILHTQAPEPPLRLGYRLALNRILLNLAVHGLNRAEAGELSVVAEEVAPDIVSFEVRHHGVTAAVEDESLRFEPFRRRAHRRAYAYSASGVGLSVCRQLVEALGGELLMAEAPDDGGLSMRFHVRLPVPDMEMVPGEPGICSG